MITGRENIIKYVSDNGMYWKLYNGRVNQGNSEKADSVQPIQVSDNNPALTPDESLSKFKQLINSLGTGVYTVKVNSAEPGTKVNFSKGYCITFFEIPAYESNPSIYGFAQQQPQNAVAAAQPAVGMVSIEEVEKLAQKRMAEMQAANELKEMKAQIREMQNQQGIGVAQIGSALSILAAHAPKTGPVIDMAVKTIMGLFMPKTALMSGVFPPDQQPQPQTFSQPETEMENNIPEEFTQERKEMAQNAIEILSGVDPKLPEHLDKLARMAQSNPTQFAFLMQMLDSQPV